MGIKIYVDQETLKNELDPIKSDIETLYTLLEPVISDLTISCTNLNMDGKDIDTQKIILNQEI